MSAKPLTVSSHFSVDLTTGKHALEAGQPASELQTGYSKDKSRLAAGMQRPPFARQASTPQSIASQMLRTRSYSRSEVRSNIGLPESERPPLPDLLHQSDTGSSAHTPNGSSPSSSISGSLEPALGGQAQYMAQEQAYLQMVRTSIDDYYGKSMGGSSRVDNADEHELESDEENLDALDDENTSALQPADLALNPSDVTNTARILERSDWQNMLTTVLTGDVFTMEKTRMQSSDNKGGNAQLWLELRAAVCGRSVKDQNRVLNARRSGVQDVLDRIMQFKLHRNYYDNIEDLYEEVGELLGMLRRCEDLFHSGKAMGEYSPQYVSHEFQDRVDALTAWYTMTQSILQELSLLKKWTGNSEADPTKPPESPEVDGERPLSLVERLMKQEGALQRMFSGRFKRDTLPLIVRARSCTLEYSSRLLEMGMPLFVGLGPIIAFPLKLHQEIVEIRLAAASHIHNPTMIMIDDALSRFAMYMRIGRALIEDFVKGGVLKPVLDKGWIFTKREIVPFNKTMLRCIRFYLEMLSSKYLEGGRTSMSFFRSFKNIEQLEGHFRFLNETCQFVDGGNVSVAEQFSSLQSRVLSRLHAYWYHQMKGPTVLPKDPKSANLEMQRWYLATIENIRSIHRKLLRLYKVIAETYENAMEMRLPRNKTRDFLRYLRDQKFFLVFVGSSERHGTYTFASPNLANQPELIKTMLLGHSPPPASAKDRDRDLEGAGAVDQESLPGVILLFSVEEALQWDGETFQLDIGVDDLPEFTSQVRLIAQGGYAQVCQAQEMYPQLSQLEITAARRSHLEKVQYELNRMSQGALRVAFSVINSGIEFRSTMRGRGVQDAVQAMLAFAREFGQRQTRLVGETRRSHIIVRLFDLCVEWISFVTEDCEPSSNKTFKWTVTALEFAMVMTRGANILAVREELFQRLQKEVSKGITLLISHFDIMGARSKAATLTDHKKRIRTAQIPSNVSLKDDEEIMAANRKHALELFKALDDQRSSMYKQGKVLDQNNTEFEFLSFASSPLTNTSMRWQLGKQIGSGAFGVVHEAQNLETFEPMAVKEVRITNKEGIKSVLKSIKDEMTVLEMLSHPNVVQYYGVEIHRDRVLIFMEYCESSLAECLADGRIADEDVTQLLSLQMLEGLAYLHQSGIVHRDIKPENILLENGIIKFVDFGAAKVIATGGQRGKSVQTRVDSLRGTPMYMAPEVITGKGGAKPSSVDIWSLGCVILQMVTGSRPWSGFDNDFAVMYQIARHTPRLPTEDQASPECRQFLMRTLERDPSKRPSAMELLHDPWIDEARELLNRARPDDYPVTMELPNSGVPVEQVGQLELVDDPEFPQLYPDYNPDEPSDSRHFEHFDSAAATDFQPANGTGVDFSKASNGVDMSEAIYTERRNSNSTPNRDFERVDFPLITESDDGPKAATTERQLPTSESPTRPKSTSVTRQLVPMSPIQE